VGWKNTALTAVRRLGAFRLLEGIYGRDRLTVLAYHRVVDHALPGFVGFRGNVSATPDEFAQQMEMIADRMTPVTLEQVVASLDGRPLPERPVLVTFDDGYRDNLEVALPVMESHGILPTVFVATDHIGTAEPFWWDLVGWWFANSDVASANLPVVGERTWSDHIPLAREWIQRAKHLADPVRQEAVDALGEVLGVGAVGDAFEGLLVDWEGVRSMVARGVSIGAHTCSHPILTRVTPERAVVEVSSSVDRVRAETGLAVLGFAYPNGQPGDFDDLARRAVADNDVPTAFSLVPGPARPSEVRSDPFAVRRVYIHHGDAPDRFAAKLAGVPRLVGRS
jgi:peptidoglycan/xylan/chitin deacetylase (PgdA/CDA1 family)